MAGRGGADLGGRAGRVNQWDVWWADLPEAGRRPVLIVTRDVAIDVRTRVTVVPTTATVRGIPTDVLLDADDGMPHECVLSFDNVLTIPKSLLQTRVCALGPVRLREARAAWDEVPGL